MAHAFGLLSIPGVYIPQSYLKIGAAYTRAIVPGPNGRPVYVEFNTSGKEAAEIGEATGPLERAKVMPAGTYRAYLQRLSDAQQHYPESQVMKASEYRGKTFKTVTGETISKPTISMNTLTVLVRADEQLFSTDGKELLLLELPIKSDVQPSSSSQSLLLSEQGDILHQTANTIGYRVGFHGKDGKVNEELGRDRESQIYGPLAGVPIRLWHEGGTTTGEDGRYVMPYMLPPCPGFSIEYTTDAYLELYYKRFNPRGQSYLPYYMVRQDWDFCTGYEVYNWLLMDTKLTMAMPAEPNLDFPLDLMVLDGAATLRGAKLGDKTEYSSATGERDHYLQEKYDFDGDEKPDWVVPGKKVKKEIEGEEREVFVKTSLEEAELQGIYLSSRYESVPADTEEDGPDFTRLIDTAPDFQDRALLETISEDDLRDTDIYVFRESNGQLVAERRGLHESELYKSYSGVDAEEGSFRFTIHLRGEKEGVFGLSGIDQGGQEFSKWQSAGGFKEEFQKRNANHLKPGEMVRIIAINRPTGYMGSLRYQLESADVSSGYMGFTGQRIEMSPPNLKVWAERKNKIEQGMTKGEEKKQLIGNEGAGLGSDISIAIYTDWRDTDGSPLPEELADYGYTGRLAKIVATNQLAPSGANNLSQFKIKPGQQVQVIQLPEKVLAKQHLYLQVAGQPDNRNPDFSSNGQASGILKYRPTKFVPVMVPLHDEEASELARQAYRKADKEHPELNLKKPEPMYAWQYRPEMQFSLYELAVSQVRQLEAEASESVAVSLDTPVLSGGVSVIDFIYTLLQSEFSQLDSYSAIGEREIIVAVGGSEIRASVGADKSVSFDNIGLLSALDSDDFLSVRLYANNDAGNILWEWAFDSVVLLPSPLDGQGTIMVSADDAEAEAQGLNALVLSAVDEPQQYSIAWSASGGRLEKGGDANVDGNFSNALWLPTKAGEKVNVTARFNSPYEFSTKTATFEVAAGKPHRIDISTSGRAAIAGAGEITVTVDVRDKFGNPVADGTELHVTADDVDFTGEQLTNGGEAQFTLTGNQSAGEKELVVSVGEITKKQDIFIDDIKLVVEAPSVVNVNERANVVIRAESDTSDLAGVEFQITSLRGTVTEGDLVLGEDNTAKTTYDAGPFPGEGKLVARINDLLFPVDITVKPRANELQVSNPLLVTQPSGSIDDMSGFSSETEFTLSGAPGELVEADLRDYLEPNLLPLAFWAGHTGSDNDQLRDEEYGRVASLQGAKVVGQGQHRESRYVEFKNASDRVVIEDSDDLARGDNVGVTLLFKPEDGAFGSELIDFSATGLRVELSASGEVIARINSEAGERLLKSSAVALGQWHRLGVHVVNGKLVLQVDSELHELVLGASLELSGSDSVSLGVGYKGGISEFGIYDWTSTPLLSFVGNGKDQQSVTVGSDGKARFKIVSHYSDLLAARASPYQDLMFTNIFISKAYAADFDESCALVTPDGLLNAAEAFVDYVVKCEIQKKVRKAEVKVRTAQGVWQTSVALLELSAARTLQAQVALLGYTWVYGAQCLDGIVTGSISGVASGICDIVASLFLVGDIRDFVIHGYYLYSDNHEKFDQATYTFAGLGIVTTLAEFTGVGISVDAAIAGGKTAAKVFKGSAMMGNLVSYLDRKVVNGAQGARVDALKIVLPMLELTAVIAFEGEEIKKFIVGAINSVDDFDIWVRYLYRMVEEGGLVARRDEVEQILEDIVFVWINSAYASPFKKIDELIAILDEVQKQAKRKSSANNAGPIFTRVIAELNQAAASGNELGKMSNKSEELVALMSFASRGGDDFKKGLTALRNSPCGAQSCFDNKTYSEFIKDFGKIDEYLVSSNSDARAIWQVIEQLSGTVTRKDGIETDVFVVARGGAGTLLVLKQLIDKGSEIVVEGFEVKVKVFGGTRDYDLVGKIGGVTNFIESKNWASGTAVSRIKDSLNVYKKTDNTDGAPGQLMKDIITTMTGEPPIGGVIRWEFPALSPDKREEMIEAVMGKIKNGGDKESERLRNYLVRAVRPGDKDASFDDVEGDFRDALTLVIRGV